MMAKRYAGAVARGLGLLSAAVLLSFTQGAVIFALVAGGVTPAAALGSSFVATVVVSLLLGLVAFAWRRRRPVAPRGATPTRRSLPTTLLRAGLLWSLASLIGLLTFLRGDVIETDSTPAVGKLSVSVVDSRGTGDAMADTRPLVVVHGGPGVPLTDDEKGVLAQLATHRMVVIYDQAGTGKSGPLEDPDDYGLDQAVDELARVIDSTGAATVDILGYSWGASIATVFTADHPERVGRLAFISPGAIPWHDAEPARFGPQSRLSGQASISAYLLALSPRNLFVYAMTSADPDATRWFADEAELDRRFRELYEATAAGLHCSEDRVGPPPAHVGFFASQVPQMHPDRAGVTAEQLERAAKTPLLVLRGECDYIPARVAGEYLDHFDAKLVAVDGAGHALLEDRPDSVLSDIADFLDEDQSGRVSPRGRGSGPR